jgi:WD40 repeat protein
VLLLLPAHAILPVNGCSWLSTFPLSGKGISVVWQVCDYEDSCLCSSLAGCRCVASGDMDGAIYLWDPKKGKPLGQCNGHKKWITSLVRVTHDLLQVTWTADADSAC